MEINNNQQRDTRTHVVGELYDTERSYVESLQIIVEKYMKPLKSYDSNKNLIESGLVDEIFYTIPEILRHHENFLSALQDRLSSDWDSSQVIGNVFIEAFTNEQIIDTYTAFINNWKNARHAIKAATQAKPAFERFLEAMSREHKNKLTLDALLIMPVQRIPRYELLIKELIKHTPEDHPDYGPLIGAQKQIHKLAVKIGRAEKEMLKQDQLRDIESLIEGHVELLHPQRDFIRYDLVTISASTTLTVAKKERVLFLFCDLLIMTSVKKKVSRRSNLQTAFTNSSNDLSLLEGNKFKLLFKVSLDQIDVKRNEQNQRQFKSQYNNILSQQHHHNQQKINELLDEKKQSIENDLILLQQIESLADRLNINGRIELIEKINQLFDQANEKLVGLDYQQHQQQQNINELLTNNNNNSNNNINNNNQQALIKNDTAAVLPSNQIDSTLANANYQGDNLNYYERQQTTAQTTTSDQNASLEFTIINIGVNTNKDEQRQAGISANLSSSSVASDHSNEQQQSSMMIGAHHSALNCGVGQQQLIDSSCQNNSTNIITSGLNQSISSSCQTLVVTFMSSERRQAFLRAFNEAKQARMKLQRDQRQQHQQQKMFSSSLNLRLSHEHDHSHQLHQQQMHHHQQQQQQQSSQLNVRSSVGPSFSGGDVRRTRLRHQDEVDFRYLESSTMATKSAQANRATFGPMVTKTRSGGSAAAAAAAASSSSASASTTPHHYAACTSTIVHQMSAPQALASISDNYYQHRQGHNDTGALVQHYDTCSPSCALDCSASQDKQKGRQHYHHHHHHHHHHHQLMHQPASQPAMLNMICCHDSHDNSPSSDGAQNLVPDYCDGTVSQSMNTTDSNMLISHQHNKRNSLMDHYQSSRALASPTGVQAIHSLKFAPKFLLTIPMNFITNQHISLQFACSASRKLCAPLSREQSFASSSNNSKNSSTRAYKTQTVEDDLGKFWLCMSNGYMSHVVLIAFRRKRVHTADHTSDAAAAAAAAVLAGEQQQQQQMAHAANSNQLAAPNNSDLAQTVYQCYNVIPVVQFSGDICKSQINCAAHVGWSGQKRRILSELSKSTTSTDAADLVRQDGNECENQIKQQDSKDNNEHRSVKMSVKSASPLIDFVNKPNRTNERFGLSESAPSSGHVNEEDKMLAQNMSKLDVSKFDPTLMKMAVNNRTNSDQVDGIERAQELSEQQCAKPSSSSPFGTFHGQANSGGRKHHHSHEYLQQSQRHHHNHHHHHHHQQQRLLSPSCSQFYSSTTGRANGLAHLLKASSGGGKLWLRHQLGQDSSNRHQHNQHHLGNTNHNGVNYHQNSSNSNNNNDNNHHHRHHYHHHHHHHSHQHHHVQTGHHNNNHHHHHGSHNNHHLYVNKHHTVPLSELRRALERRSRVVGSDVEVGEQRERASRHHYRNRLALPPNNTPYEFDKLSFESLDNDNKERRCSPANSVELKDSNSSSSSNNNSRILTKKARSSTPPARHADSSSGDNKSFRSAKMLRHQASLRTSSILAKLVGGATKSSAYLRRRDLAHKAAKRQHGAKTTSSRQNSDDNDTTDTDNSARGGITQSNKQQGDNKSAPIWDKTDSNVLSSATIHAASAAAAGATGQQQLRINPTSNHRNQSGGFNGSSSNMNASIVSPLSSVSSLASTNSSLTVNSVCASSRSRDSCSMIFNHLCHQPAWSSVSCCAFDTDQTKATESKCSNEQTTNQTKTGQSSYINCPFRPRSATVPCRASCYLNLDKNNYPDSYLLTKCSNKTSTEAKDNFKNLKDDLLADRYISQAINESYRVSEIVKDSKDPSEPREVYHRGSNKDLSPSSSKPVLNDYLGTTNQEQDLNGSLWLGCDDGSIVIIYCLNKTIQQYNSSTKATDIIGGGAASAAAETSLASSVSNNCSNVHCEIKLDASICHIKNYKDQMVFVALSNGQLVIFARQQHGKDNKDNEYKDDLKGITLDECKKNYDNNNEISAGWLINNPTIVTVCQSDVNCTSKLCIVNDKKQLWYSYGSYIYVLNMDTWELVETISTPTSCVPIKSVSVEQLELTECLNGIWVSFNSSPLILFYDCSTFKLLLEMSLLEPVNKVLSYGNEIIRQHKTACLGSTALLSMDGRANESGNEKATSGANSTSLFVGTTAGIIIYLNICHQQLKEHIEAEKLVWNPQVISLRHGHSGQVKFLRLVEMECERDSILETTSATSACHETPTATSGRLFDQNTLNTKQLCLVSAGAGIDFYGPNNEQQVITQLNGAEDCLNHMILWQL